VAAFSTATKTATETTWPMPFRQLKGFGHVIINADKDFGTYSGVSLGYNLASIFAGALSPLIAIGLMTAYKPETWPISVYMIGLALITIVSVYFAGETRNRAKA
jgi:CBS domain containing-hemolysin-like protein